jgi:hypothetical protein
MALVYIYRSPSMVGVIFPDHFEIDKVDVARLNVKEYTWIYVPASAHIMKYKRLFTNVTIKDLFHHDYDDQISVWKSGVTYFYRWDKSARGCGYPCTIVIEQSMSEIGRDQAVQELSLYHYVPSFNADKLKAVPALATDEKPGPEPGWKPAGVPASGAPSSTPGPSPPQSSAPPAEVAATKP